MTVFDVNPNFQAAAWPKHWEEVKRRGSFTFESQHRTKEGGLVPVEITVNYIAFDGKEYNCASFETSPSASAPSRRYSEIF